MVFNSLTFVVFLAIVLAAHALPLPWAVKKFNLLIASYVFYAAWNPPFVLLLMLVAVIDFFLARRISASTHLAARRAYLCMCLILNLCLLGLFKYGHFLLENFAPLGAVLGIPFEVASPSFILPLG